jgi:predicted ABC-type ATPase
MAHEYPKIPVDQHQKILAEEILRDPSYTDVTPQERPRAIIMAGQPGAGKGNLVDAVKAELGGNVVTVDPDAMRDYHPQANTLRKQRPYTWSGETHGDASAWAAEKRDAAVSDRKHLILDTTTPRADVIKDLQAKGYDVEVRAIATHRIESELGVDQRFAKQLMDEGHGRYVPGEVRDNVYQQLPDQLDKVARDTGAPIRVSDREGQLHYDSRTQPKVSPGQALETAREGRMNIFRAGELERSIHGQRQLHRALPENLPNAKVDASTATHLLQERNAVGVEKGLSDLATEARQSNLRTAVPVMGKALGVAGTAYGIYEGVNETRSAIEQAQSNREQWVRGAEATADGGVRSAVTGIAGAGGGALGATGGAMTSPVTGPVGPIVGGVVVGGAASVLADKAYADSRLQQFSKYLGREAGQLGYDHISKEGRLLREVNGLKEDLQTETHPQKRQALEDKLANASERFGVEAERNSRYFEARGGIEQRWEKTHAQFPQLDKDDVNDALGQHIDAGKRPDEAARAALSDAVHDKYPRALPHHPPENYRALSNQQLMAQHGQHAQQLVQARHDVLALGANTDSRNNLDQGWPKELAQQRHSARIENGFNAAWKETGHVSAIRNAMLERGMQRPELPAELRERSATTAAAPSSPAEQQDPRDAFRAQENRDRSSSPPTVSPVSSAHQRQFNMVRDALAPGLSAHGHSPEDIDRISAAAVGHAQQHAHRGDIQSVYLSKDGQRVAVLQEGQPMGEYSVNHALTQSKDQHLEQAHAAATTQAREQRQEPQDPTTSERTTPAHAMH